MIERINFDFTQKEDKERFNNLSKEDKENIIGKSQEEGESIKGKVLELKKGHIVSEKNNQAYNIADKIVEQEKYDYELEETQDINGPNRHLIKIFLSDKEKKLSLKNLEEKYGISKDQAYRARKIGSFCINAHIPKEASGINKPTTRKNIRPLTEEEKIMSISVLAKRLEIAESSASRSKQRGYVVEKGRYTNALPDGNMPEGITEKEIISDCGTAYSRLKKQYPAISTHREDLINEGIMRLLEVTAENKFIHPHWRQKTAYYAMFNYAIKNIFRPYHKEKSLPDHDKDKTLTDHSEDLFNFKKIL